MTGKLMRLMLAVLAMLLVGIVLATPAAAQASASAAAQSGNWRARYWNNPQLQGDPIVEREEAVIDYNWNGSVAPAPGVNPTQFGAKWVRTTDFQEGTYRFTATMDDGMRVYVDGNLLIDSWKDQPAATVKKDLFLNGGQHKVRVDYYNGVGGGVAQLSWKRLETQTQASWRGEYFNNTTLSGAPALVRNDAKIDFDWGGGSPGPGVGGDYFSVRWTGAINGSPGRYRFTTLSDDGVRLWVNGRLLIDKWFDQQAAYHMAEIDLPNGAATVQMEYYDGAGGARVSLHYDRIGNAQGNGGGSGPWWAEYYNGRSLSGPVVVARQEADVNFNWGNGSPAANILGVDSFSARFTRNVDLAAGRYRFTATADDGVRVWVNGQLIIDQWREQNAASHQAEINLPGGSIPIRVEYYENMGAAQLRLTWAWVAGNGGAPASGNWRAEYFNNTALSGVAAVVRNEGQPAFNWGLGSPAPGVIGADYFSARWTRTMDFAAGRYRFTTTTDDGVRLWVNNTLLIDNWRNQGARPVSAEIDLPGGSVSLRMEYYEADVLAEARLDWVRLGPAANTGGPGVPGSLTATVNSYRLNVRLGPGVGYTVITALNRGTVVQLAGYRNSDASWVMVVLPNGTRGWSYAGLLQSSYPFSSLTLWTGDGGTTTPPSGANTATVKAYRLNVRLGPGVSYSIMTTVSRGAALQLLARNSTSTWVKVVVPGGSQGWVNASYLNMPVSAASLPLGG